MAACCPPGSLGPAPLNTRTPKGATIHLESNEGESSPPPLPCYQVGPKNPKRIICVFSDVFGVDSGNHYVFCDTLQEALGETTAVWMPDLFRGAPLMFPSFLDQYLGTFAIVPKLPYFLYSVRTRISADGIDRDLKEIIQRNVDKVGCESLGCAGFCFGGFTVTRALAAEGCAFSAGVGIHPSLVPEEVIANGSGKAATLLQRTEKKPILFLNAKQDTGTKSNVDIIRQAAECRGITPDEIAIDFPDMDHGFVTRGDSSVPSIRESQDKAIKLTADFLERHLFT